MANPSQSLGQIQFDPGATTSPGGRPTVDVGRGPKNWSITNSGAATVQATISKAASTDGHAHLAQAITATFSTDATAPAAATPLLVNLRDGATGAGTILWQSYINVPASAGATTTISVTDLNILGTVNTAMTLEFSAGGAAHTLESVALVGITVL